MLSQTAFLVWCVCVCVCVCEDMYLRVLQMSRLGLHTQMLALQVQPVSMIVWEKLQG